MRNKMLSPGYCCPSVLVNFLDQHKTWDFKITQHLLSYQLSQHVRQDPTMQVIINFDRRIDTQ